MKPIKKIYCEGFADIIVKILSKKFEIVIDDKNPDFAFLGPYTLGANAKNPLRFANAVRIFITGEAVSTDWNIYDYGISFDEMEFGDRYLRCPYWAIVIGDDTLKGLVNRPKMTLADLQKKKSFCNFIYSNRNGHEIRKHLFYEISKYKKVDSWGRWLNNVGKFAKDKIEVLSNYKFTIACENAEFLGYTTEKIVDSYIGNSLPIYWGDKSIGLEFNKKSMINVNDFASVDEVVAKVKELDKDDKKFLEMMNEKIFTIDPLEHKKNLKKFLIYIVSQDKKDARRCGAGMFPDRYYRQYNESWNATHLQKNFWKWLVDVRSNKSVIYVQLFGIKLDIGNFWFGLQKILQYGFNIRFKRFHTQIRLFGIDFINKSH